MFEYFTKIYTSFDALQRGLSEKGKENWRLHTCDEVQKCHERIDGGFLVVMDRVKSDDPEPEISEEKEGMACKG